MEAHILKKFIDHRFSEIFDKIAEEYLPESQFQDAKGIITTVKPTVVIGLGGSGAKAVARLKWRIREFYRGPEFENERKSISFLVADTLSYDNIKKEDPDGAQLIYRVLSQDEYVYLGGFHISQ